MNILCKFSLFEQIVSSFEQAWDSEWGQFFIPTIGFHKKSHFYDSWSIIATGYESALLPMTDFSIVDNVQEKVNLHR